MSENKINKEWRAHMFSDIQSELICVMTIITEKYSSSDASTLIINVFQNQRINSARCFVETQIKRKIISNSIHRIGVAETSYSPGDIPEDHI